MKRIRLDRPKNFINLAEAIPGITVDVRYYTGENFVGERIDGYEAPIILLTEKAGEALEKVEKQLNKMGFGLKVFDGYRPKRAVEHFFRWGEKKEDGKTKEVYYPDLSKKEIFEKGFISLKSSHTRGSTVDLTVIHYESKEALDMGGYFDFFSEISYSDYDHLSIEQIKNRVQLKYLMRSEGFEPLQQEWWHFTLIEEPYPKTYFDFPIIL
ncbi:MAG: M15 family metallopeptidase [Eubacteriaceae bacterium]